MEIENVKSEHTQLQEHQDFTVKTLSEQLENVLKDKEDLQSVKQSQAEEISELQNELREQVSLHYNSTSYWSRWFNMLCVSVFKVANPECIDTTFAWKQIIKIY